LSLRQQLGEANKLDTKPDLLVKFAVLEYAWDDFFSALVANVDAQTGTSELLGQLMTAADTEGKAAASEVLAKYLKEPGLIDFLSAAPAIDGKTNLQPYLFLAQTSLGRSQSVGIVTIDESTKSFVKAIEGTDPIPSRAAAKKAAQDSAVAGAVFRQLTTDLATAKDQASIANILGALEIIATAQPDFFKQISKALENLNDTNASTALAASTLINAAEKAGMQISKSLKDRFTGSSRIADALSKPRTHAKRGA
jgi:hypothetical protein